MLHYILLCRQVEQAEKHWVIELSVVKETLLHWNMKIPSVHSLIYRVSYVTRNPSTSMQRYGLRCK
jgi:hypothetical protein